jgi:hypothetical protein
VAHKIHARMQDPHYIDLPAIDPVKQGVGASQITPVAGPDEIAPSSAFRVGDDGGNGVLDQPCV